MRNCPPARSGQESGHLRFRRLKKRPGPGYVCLALFVLLAIVPHPAGPQPPSQSTPASTALSPAARVQDPHLLQNLLAEPADSISHTEIAYNPALGPPPGWHTPSGDSLIVLETFDYPRQIGQPPHNWEGRSGWRYSRTKKKDIYYTIRSEEDNLFLRAETKGKAVNFGRGANVNLRLYNKIRWRWRAYSLPEDGNEEDSGKNDSAGAVRLVFGRGLGVKSLKYVWSTTLPVGTETESPLSPRVKVIVKESGTDRLGQWVWVEADAYEDYKRLFGGEPRPVDVLSIITDSDNTGSPVKTDYDDFMFLIAPPDTAGMVPDFMLENPQE